MNTDRKNINRVFTESQAAYYNIARAMGEAPMGDDGEDTYNVYISVPTKEINLEYEIPHNPALTPEKRAFYERELKISADFINAPVPIIVESDETSNFPIETLGPDEAPPIKQDVRTSKSFFTMVKEFAENNLNVDDQSYESVIEPLKLLADSRWKEYQFRRSQLFAMSSRYSSALNSVEGKRFLTPEILVPYVIEYHKLTQGVVDVVDDIIARYPNSELVKELAHIRLMYGRTEPDFVLGRDMFKYFPVFYSDRDRRRAMLRYHNDPEYGPVLDWRTNSIVTNPEEFFDLSNPKPNIPKHGPNTLERYKKDLEEIDKQIKMDEERDRRMSAENKDEGIAELPNDEYDIHFDNNGNVISPEGERKVGVGPAGDAENPNVANGGANNSDKEQKYAEGATESKPEENPTHAEGEGVGIDPIPDGIPGAEENNSQNDGVEQNTKAGSTEPYDEAAFTNLKNFGTEAERINKPDTMGEFVPTGYAPLDAIMSALWEARQDKREETKEKLYALNSERERILNEMKTKEDAKRLRDFQRVQNQNNQQNPGQPDGMGNLFSGILSGIGSIGSAIGATGSAIAEKLTSNRGANNRLNKIEREISNLVTFRDVALDRQYPRLIKSAGMSIASHQVLASSISSLNEAAMEYPEGREFLGKFAEVARETGVSKEALWDRIHDAQDSEPAVAELRNLATNVSNKPEISSLIDSISAAENNFDASTKDVIKQLEKMKRAGIDLDGAEKVIRETMSQLDCPDGLVAKPGETRLDKMKKKMEETIKAFLAALEKIIAVISFKGPKNSS